MSPNQVLTAFQGIKRGTNGHVMSLAVTTQAQSLNLRPDKFHPQPYYLMASDKPIDYERFFDLVLTVQDRLFKAWLICGKGGFIEHEVTLSNYGVSVDGRLHEVSGVEKGVEYIRAQMPQALLSQNYYLGRNAQAIILGMPQSQGLKEEAFPVSPRGQTAEDFGEFSLSLMGATSSGSVNEMLGSLVKGTNLLRLEITQPALSVVVESLVIFRNQVNDTFSYECYFRPTTPAIIQNLRRFLLVNEE